MDNKLIFVVGDDCDNMNALTFLRGHCGLSARMITRLKREKNGIMMDGRILRTIDSVSAGKTVEINLPCENSQIKATKGELDIVYEDDNILVVNKPYAMPVHPVKEHQENTLANIVAYYNQQRQKPCVFRAINRLDKDTSGLVLIAKDRYSANALKGKTFKRYLALCHGIIDKEGTVDAPMGLTEESKMVRYIIPDGQPAITHYTPVKSLGEYTLIKLWLETGRTHQIRCHMSSIGHSLVGDDLYGGSVLLTSRQMLHCAELELVHPISKEIISLKTDLPADMQRVVDMIENDIIV